MKVGFIGTGTMGGRMARNLLKGGHQLTVNDVRQERTAELVKAGAVFARSPKDVAQAPGVEVVMTSLPGPAEVEQVARGPQGLRDAMRPGMVYVDLSTNSPAVIRSIAAEFKQKGIDVLDSPVSGGQEGAEAGTLGVYVGGEEAVYQRMKPLLDCIGTGVMYCGAIGSGEICKLCNNLVAISFLAILPEAFTMGIKAGVPAKTIYEAISRGSADHPLMHTWTKTVFAGNFPQSNFPGLGLKDVGLAVELGRQFGVPMEISNIVLQRLVEGMARGFGGSTVRVQEDHAGVQIRF